MANSIYDLDNPEKAKLQRGVSMLYGDDGKSMSGLFAKTEFQTGQIIDHYWGILVAHDGDLKNSKLFTWVLF
jgi:hypothetical protein